MAFPFAKSFVWFPYVKKYNKVFRDVNLAKGMDDCLVVPIQRGSQLTSHKLAPLIG